MAFILTDRSGRFSALKTLVFALVCLPALWLLARTLRGDLGALPLKEATHFSGLWAIRLLLVTLALTPAMRIFGQPRLALVRRMTGVATFCYATLHFSFFVWDKGGNINLVASELINRVYLTIGYTALLGLTALAMTSFDSAVRAMGKHWKQLHKLVFPTAILALLHYFMQSKLDVSRAAFLAGLFILLMLYRGMFARRLDVTPLNLALCGLLAGILTAATEVAWYGLVKGLNVWPVLQANLMPASGLRPALLVAGIGVCVAILKGVQTFTKRARAS